MLKFFEDKRHFAVVAAVLFVLSIFSIAFVQKTAYAENIPNSNFSCQFNLFSSQYANHEGTITVKSDSGTTIIAPGTSNNSTFTLTNNSAATMSATIIFGSPFSSTVSADFPLQIKLKDSAGNYVLGSDTSWESIAKLEGATITDTFEANETKTYEIPWQWPYDSGNDAVDTKYGKLAAEGAEAPQININFDISEYEITAATGDNSQNILAIAIILGITATTVISAGCLARKKRGTINHA